MFCVCVCVGEIDIPFLAVTQEQWYIQGEGICLLEEVLWWGGLVELHCQKHLAKFLFLWPSSFVFLM